MSKFWTILVIGILIRIFLSLTTFHPDIQVFNLAGKLISEGNILNLYEYSSDTAVFNYPPSVYLFHGIFNFFFTHILQLQTVNQFIIDHPSNYGDFLFNIHLLLLKLPYFIPDLLIGLLLIKLFDKRANLVFALWMFNPINLYTTYMMGQFDVIPTLFVVLSVYFVIRNKLDLAAFSLGFGIAFKLFPLFLVVPFIIFGKGFWDRTKLLFLTSLPYILSILPYLPSQDFRTVALFANQNTKSLYANIPVSGGESILLFPAFLILFYLLIWNRKIDRLILWKLYSIPLLLFFIFTHYHPQWLVWIMPFLILDLAIEKAKNLLPHFLIFGSWLSSLFLFDPSLTVGIFSPLVPVLRNMPDIWTLLGFSIDYNLSKSVLQTVLVASTLYLIYNFFPRLKDEQN